MLVKTLLDELSFNCCFKTMELTNVKHFPGKTLRLNFFHWYLLFQKHPSKMKNFDKLNAFLNHHHSIASNNFKPSMRVARKFPFSVIWYSVNKFTVKFSLCILFWGVSLGCRVKILRNNNQNKHPVSLKKNPEETKIRFGYRPGSNDNLITIEEIKNRESKSQDVYQSL